MVQSFYKEPLRSNQERSATAHRNGRATGTPPTLSPGTRSDFLKSGRMLQEGNVILLVNCGFLPIELAFGRVIEFYGPQRERATRVLRLVRVRMARGGYGFGVGFLASLRGAYLSRAVRAGYVVADVRKVDRMEPICATRTIVAVWSPSGRSAEIASSSRDLPWNAALNTCSERCGAPR